MTKQELIDDPNSCWNKAGDPVLDYWVERFETVLAWAAGEAE